MLCLDPFVKAGQAYPCGQCLPCLRRRRQLWVHRLMLESLCHSENVFVTLTYADDMLPMDMSVDPAILGGFMKRLRRRIEPRRIRFYGVGEYGDLKERPHYHVVLFNYPRCLHGRSMYDRERTNCCSSCDLIRDVWGNGYVDVGDVNTKSLGYVCGYITKNMRRTDDDRLRGRWPEFARMSLKPGLGYAALDELSQTLMRYDLDESEADVPTGLRHGKIVRPLGRYLRGKLREMLGVEKKDYVDEEMQVLFERAKEASPHGGEIRRVLFKNLIVDAGAQKVLNMEARAEIFKSRRAL